MSNSTIPSSTLEHLYELHTDLALHNKLSNVDEIINTLHEVKRATSDLLYLLDQSTHQSSCDCDPIPNINYEEF